MNEKDRDSLCFLWVSDPNELLVLHLEFHEVLFSSMLPSIITLKPFVNQILPSQTIYVSDLLVMNFKFRLASAGFNLRKFITNSNELHHLMQKNESATTTDSGISKSKPVANNEEKEESRRTEEDLSCAN